MSQSSSSASRRRRAGGRRSRKQGGLSPFVIMGGAGAIIVLALLAYSYFQPKPVARDIPSERNVLQPGAVVAVEEFADFQ